MQLFTREERRALQDLVGLSDPLKAQSTASRSQVPIDVVRGILDLPELAHPELRGSDCWLLGGAVLRWLCRRRLDRGASRGDYDYFLPSLEALERRVRRALAEGFRYRCVRSRIGVCFLCLGPAERIEAEPRPEGGIPFVRNHCRRCGAVDEARTAEIDAESFPALTEEAVLNANVGAIELIAPNGDLIHFATKVFEKDPLSTVRCIDFSIVQLIADSDTLYFGFHAWTDLLRGRFRQSFDERQPLISWGRMRKYSKLGMRPEAETAIRLNRQFLGATAGVLWEKLRRPTLGRFAPRGGISQQPCFFIVGPPRSGTTMLRLVLNHHPEIAVPPETWFFPFLLRRSRRYSDFSTPELIERFARDLAEASSESARPAAEVFSTSVEDIVSALATAHPRNYAQAFAAWMNLLARRDGKRHWGEKTPFHTAFLRILKRCYPNARFIALVRDPRDVVVSLHRTSWGRKSYPTTVDAAMRWRYAVQGIRRARRRLGESLLELRYEDLVSDPELWMRRICEFLGVGYVPEILRFHEQAERHLAAGTEGWHGRVSQPISTHAIGRWRDGYEPHEIGTIEWICASEMRRLGYPRQGHTRSWTGPRDRLSWALGRRMKRLLGYNHWTRLLRPRVGI